MKNNGIFMKFFAFVAIFFAAGALYLRAGWNGPAVTGHYNPSAYPISATSPAFGNQTSPQPIAPLNTPDMIPASFKDVAQRLEPVVVNIFTTQTFRAPPMGMFTPPDRKQNSLGSGFVIDPAGYILTNVHVVGEADEIRVQFTDEREYSAVVVGLDPQTDIALIKIVNATLDKPLPYVTMGNSDALDVGDWVVAVGNPFGLGGSVTAGIVSAKSRSIHQTRYDDFIQTDASINPGNSGGPLVNLKGEVVGINTSIYSPSGGNVGIGFAIPINMAKSVIEQLKSNGKVTRSWLGVVLQHITPELAQSFGMTEATGALVADVYPGSPAEKGGLKAGDVILKIDGNEISDQNELARVVSLSAVDSDIVVEVLRDGKVVQLTVKLQAMPDQRNLAMNRFIQGGRGGAATSDLLGATVTQLSEEDQHRSSTTTGVKVLDVRRDGSAHVGGLVVGDIIVKINGEQVATPEDYRRISASLSPGKMVRMLVIRGDGKLFLAFRIN